jgi:hypothetical protein
LIPTFGAALLQIESRIYSAARHFRQFTLSQHLSATYSIVPEAGKSLQQAALANSNFLHWLSSSPASGSFIMGYAGRHGEACLPVGYC